LLKTYPSAEVRRRLLELLAPYGRPEIVAAIEEVKESDPDPGIRRLAKIVLDGETVPVSGHGSDNRVV
jgi:hypothetical protein